MHLWLAVARRKLEIRQFCCKFVGVCRGNPQIRSFFAARCIAFGQQPSQFGVGQLVEPAGSQWQWLEMERHPALGFEATHPKILHLGLSENRVYSQ